MNKIWAVNKLDNQTAEILLYGYIGGDKLNAADFVAELKMIEANYTTIKLRINSGGGSIFEGFAIFNAIKQSSCKVDAYIDGLAASMASVIVLACDKIYMSKVAMLMTHRPSGAAMGNPDQLRSTADMLEQLEETVCTIYKDRTGLTMEEVKTKYMGISDNWLSAQDALTAKLIDGVYDAPKPASLPPATMRAEQDLVNYFTNSFNHSNMKQITLSAPVMAALGLTADSDQSAAEAVIATMAAKVDTVTAELTTAKETIQNFEANAINAKAEKLVDDAIVARKIVAGDRDKYVRLAKADFEGTESLVNDLKPYMSVADQLNPNDAKSVELTQLLALSGRELHMQGKFERLKQLNMDEFKNKYKEYFGSEYKA